MNGSPTVQKLLYAALALIFTAALLAGAVLSVQLRNQARTSMEIKQTSLELKSHIDCIALFLSQTKPDRAQARIEDIEDCKIVRTP